MPQSAIFGPFFAACTWVLVAFRAVHSAVHSTIDVVMRRFHLYPVSCLALWLVSLYAALACLAPAG